MRLPSYIHNRIHLSQHRAAWLPSDRPYSLLGAHASVHACAGWVQVAWLPRLFDKGLPHLREPRQQLSSIQMPYVATHDACAFPPQSRLGWAASMQRNGCVLASTRRRNPSNDARKRTPWRIFQVKSWICRHSFLCIDAAIPEIHPSLLWGGNAQASCVAIYGIWTEGET